MPPGSWRNTADDYITVCVGHITARNWQIDLHVGAGLRLPAAAGQFLRSCPENRAPADFLATAGQFFRSCPENRAPADFLTTVGQFFRSCPENRAPAEFLTTDVYHENEKQHATPDFRTSRPVQMHTGAAGQRSSAIVTPLSPSPKAARRKLFTRRSERSSWCTASRRAPVPFPWTMRTLEAPASTASSR